MVLADSAKVSIADYYTQNGTYPGAATTPTNDALAATGKYSALTVGDGDGKISVKMNATGVSKDLQGKTVTLSPSVANGAFKWTCTTDFTNTNMNPAGCN
ncbi:pilin [Shewanella dokdonensis]|nr:pilin [Shewanella dokdonensis]